MQRLIYVSESKIATADADTVITQIVAGAQKRNAHLSLTGALLFTMTHFAQVLEGRQEDIDELMVSLQRDKRHEMIATVYQSSVTERRFPEWKMAYQGPSQFISRHVNRLLHATSGLEQRRATEWLIQLANEF